MNKKSDAFEGIQLPVTRWKACESSRLFDVFINHRGPDVKHGLAAQLYNSLQQLGIRAFLDSQEKELGIYFPNTIKTAIRSARVHIAIFSPRYAESAWCLAELVEMLESKAKIIPLFYEVEPRELRHIETGQYAAAFIQYEEKSRYLEKLSEWKEALQYLSFIAGEEFYNSKDCKEIVAAVQKEVQRKRSLHVAKYPVGLNKLVEDFERRCLDELVQDFENQCKLHERKHKSNIVGIFGMGGVGKTTLAKELFNRKHSNYSRACFLFDVREASEKRELPSMQSKLLNDLFDEKNVNFRSRDEGASYLMDRLQRSHFSNFLIVLDDIDHTEQLDALLIMDILANSRNSLVIVTTRDVGVVITAGITVVYHLRGMDANYGREFFCWHAFGQPCPPTSWYEALVDEFVEVYGGLPLSLQVLGRHVHGRDCSYWESELAKARKALPRDVKQRSRISFESLDDVEKQVFIDTACFLVGEATSTAERAWMASGWNARHALETLKDKCLVEETGVLGLSVYELTGSVLRMHDHLRDLLGELTRELSPPHRLWRHDRDLQSLESLDFKTMPAGSNIRCFSSFINVPSQLRKLRTSQIGISENDARRIHSRFAFRQEFLSMSLLLEFVRSAVISLTEHKFVFQPYNHLLHHRAASSYGWHALHAVGEFKFKCLRENARYRQKECIHSIDQPYKLGQKKKKDSMFSRAKKKHKKCRSFLIGRQKVDSSQSVQQLTPRSPCLVSKFSLFVLSCEVVIALGFIVCSH